MKINLVADRKVCPLCTMTVLKASSRHGIFGRYTCDGKKIQVVGPDNRYHPATPKQIHEIRKEGSREYTDALHKAFDRVKNSKHWKNPINRLVTIQDQAELELIDEAIIFFTGSVPQITPTKKPNQYRVTAAGYFRTIGI